MAKIVSSDLAPSGEVRYSLGSGASFTLGGKNASYECDDPQVLARAAANSWLKVEHDKRAAVQPVFRDVSVDPKDDVLSAQSDVAKSVNDPDAIKAIEDAKAADTTQPLAVEAGTDQEKKVVEGGVAQTLAADAAADKKSTAKETK